MTWEVPMDKLRLDKIIADTGLASRREATLLIKSGFVTADGRTALSGDEKYDPSVSVILLSGKPIGYKKTHYFMMNKPAGCVSATSDKSERTVMELLSDRDKRLNLFTVGRLDKDTEGLLLLTDDGDWAHRIISPSKNIWKTYAAETDGLLTPDDVDAFRDGLILRDGFRCLPAFLEIVVAETRSKALVRVREGKYHQVKRMLASRGKPVVSLKRLSVGGLALDGSLIPGAYRELTEDEAASVFLDK
jgi:16S rRNA pseudouridine516 synthase